MTLMVTGFLPQENKDQVFIFTASPKPKAIFKKPVGLPSTSYQDRPKRGKATSPQENKVDPFIFTASPKPKEIFKKPVGLPSTSYQDRPKRGKATSMEQEKKRKEAEEITRIRMEAVHKAQPMPKFKPLPNKINSQIPLMEPRPRFDKITQPTLNQNFFINKVSSQYS